MQNFAALSEDHRGSAEKAARQLLLVETAVDAECMYFEAFASLAREYGCYVAAGSIALPPMETEPSKGGRHVSDGSKLYNTAYLSLHHVRPRDRALLPGGTEEVIAAAG